MFRGCFKILGINNYSFGNFPDNQMDSLPMLKICKFIEKKLLLLQT